MGFQLSHRKTQQDRRHRREGFTYDGKARKKDYLNRFRF